VIVNERITGKLVITKIDDANKPLANVIFKIYDSEGYVEKKLPTDSNGKASVNVNYGTYFFKEVSAPEGYIMDETLYRFTVNAENRTFYKTITNERYKGNLLIVKTDEDNTPIEGVEFNILDSDKNVITKITTNEKGLAGLKNLPLGTYYYKEVEAPEGYVLDNTEHEFKIENEKVIEAVVYNTKEELPKTGGLLSSDAEIVLVISIISVLGYILVCALRKKQEI